MKFMGKTLKSFADPELVIFAMHGGQEAGFAFGLPNYNEITGSLNGRLFPFGVFKLLLAKKRLKELGPWFSECCPITSEPD